MFIKMPQGCLPEPRSGPAWGFQKELQGPMALFPLLQAHLLLPPLSEDIWLLWSQGGS